MTLTDAVTLLLANLIGWPLLHWLWHLASPHVDLVKPEDDHAA